MRTNRDMTPEKTRKGVRFASFSATYRDGNLVHTGVVAGSIPASPTNISAILAPLKEVPLGSTELRSFRRVRTDWVKIPLSRGYFAKIDVEDVERVCARKWSAVEPEPGRVYAHCLGDEGKHVYLHRFLTDAPKGVLVDHKNGDTLDYRKANLREATHSQNSSNNPRRKRGVTGFRGVVQRGPNRFQAKLKHERRTISAGYYIDAISAARAYDIAARKLHGEFAVLNFPP